MHSLRIDKQTSNLKFVRAMFTFNGMELHDIGPHGSFYAEFSKVRGEVFPHDPPTSTAVQVTGLLLGARVEIDAIAFLPKGRGQGWRSGPLVPACYQHSESAILARAARNLRDCGWRSS